MSDMDAELGAVFDGTAGIDVINVDESIAPPDTSGNPLRERRLPENNSDDEADQSDDDRLTRTLGKAFDQAQAREVSERKSNPHRPDGWGVDAGNNDRVGQTAGAEYDWKQLPLAERQRVDQAAQHLALAKQAAEALGLKVETVSDIDAVLRMMDGQKGKYESNVPLSDQLKELVPDAETYADAEAKLLKRARPYRDFESDYAQNGPAAFVRAAHRLGHDNIIDAGDRVAQATIAANFHGFNLGQLAEAAGFVPVERVQELIEQQQQDADAAIVGEWSQNKHDLSPEVRQEMAALLSSPKFKVVDGEGTLSVLERVYQKVTRDRARRGARSKTAMERDLDAVADKHYGTAS